MKSIINSDSNYISFNYTNTLERLYGIDSRCICYIHENANEGDELVLGHRNDSYYPEWDDSNPDGDLRLLEAGAFMERFRKETYKPIELICDSNRKLNEFLDDYVYSDVYMMGLSYYKC